MSAVTPNENIPTAFVVNQPTQQPNQSNKNDTNSQLRPHLSDWGGSLVDCDLKSSLLTAFCPCLNFGYNMQAIGQGDWWWCCAVYFCIPPVVTAWGRAQVLNQLTSEDQNQGCIAQLPVATLCHCCALAQERRALAKYSETVQQNMRRW